MLQCCNVSMLQCCNVAKLQCCNVANLQTSNLVTDVRMNVPTDRWASSAAVAAKNRLILVKKFRYYMVKILGLLKRFADFRLCLCSAFSKKMDEAS